MKESSKVLTAMVTDESDTLRAHTGGNILMPFGSRSCRDKYRIEEIIETDTVVMKEVIALICSMCVGELGFCIPPVSRVIVSWNMSPLPISV
jgi:hypothetical protein